MSAIMKCKQVVSQDRKCKAMKSNKKTNRKHKYLFRGSSHCSTFPSSPLWRISTKSTKEIFTPEPLHPIGLHKLGVPNSHQSNLYTRGILTQRNTSNKVINKTTNFSLTTPYRMGLIFGSRSEVRKFSCKESKESLKTTEKT